MFRKHKITVKKDEADEWRWTRVAGNNKIVGASTEGYVSKWDALKNIWDTQGGRFTVEIAD